MTNKVKNNINTRIIGLYLLVILISSIVLAQIINIQYFNAEISTNSQPRYFSVKAPRGNIIADDGSLLAISMPLYDVRLDMSVMQEDLFYNEVRNLSISLHNLFKDKSSEYYESFLLESKKRKANKYILLRNKVTHNELSALKRMPILKLGQNRGGLIAVERPNRENPFGLLAQRTIGKLRAVNPVGIERAYNQTLSGVDGKNLKRKIQKGVWVPQDSEGNILPKAGDNIITTLNVDMQDVAERALEKSLIKNNADWGCVVMMEVETGEVKVIANLRKDTNNQVSEWFNYAMAQHIAPGSTFKLASIIAGIEDNFFKLTDTIDVKGGKVKYYDRVMLDSDHNYNKITIHKAFIISSNVGVSSIINQHYKKNPSAYLDRIYQMGLSESLDLELPFPDNLKMPIPHQGSWSGVTLPWMSTGYEMQLTPIHMLTFYNAVANKGKMISPIFVSKIVRDGVVIDQKKTSVITSSICSKSTINKVVPLLIDVVDKGTAKNIKTNKYKIAGKTGTTVLNYTKRKSDEKKKYQASFVGFFPAESPKYSCIVVISNPNKDNVYGGSVAAPVFRELSDKVYALDMDLHKSFQVEKINNMSFPEIKKGIFSDVDTVINQLNISTNKKLISTSIKDFNIDFNEKNIIHDLEKGKIPDLTGLNIKDAVYLLENYGLVVKTIGYGSVKDQSIKQGMMFKKGLIIKLILS